MSWKDIARRYRRANRRGRQGQRRAEAQQLRELLQRPAFTCGDLADVLRGLADED